MSSLVIYIYDLTFELGTVAGEIFIACKCICNKSPLRVLFDVFALRYLLELKILGQRHQICCFPHE